MKNSAKVFFWGRWLKCHWSKAPKYLVLPFLCWHCVDLCLWNCINCVVLCCEHMLLCVCCAMLFCVIFVLRRPALGVSMQQPSRGEGNTKMETYFCVFFNFFCQNWQVIFLFLCFFLKVMPKFASFCLLYFERLSGVYSSAPILPSATLPPSSVHASMSEFDLRYRYLPKYHQQPVTQPLSGWADLSRYVCFEKGGLIQDKI